MKKLRFNELPLSGHILSAVEEMGFEEASPIQSETIPIILEGRDVIGQAQTGTGKTAAFAIPIIEKLTPGSRELQALVLCPTRELVMQITEEFRKLMKFMGSVSDASVVAVYGGQEIDRQFKALKKKPLIIVGTPGRMMDHMRRGSISLTPVSMVVLDEADEMLDMGFREDIEYILGETSTDRQTVMFSATMSKDILSLTNRFQKDPVVIDVTSQKINAPIIDQMSFEISERSKPEAVARLIDYYDIKLALVFCNTKSKVDDLVEVLKTRGYFAEGLHGDMSQKQREKVMAGFRNGTVEILVATDVAGRGIDVNDIAAVFNYDLPRDDEDYIHRIGRTGRAGKSGRSFTFVTGREVYNLRRIERSNGIKISRGTIPTIDDLDSTMIKSYSEKIKVLAEKGALSRYVRIVESLIGDDYTSLDVAAVLLKLAMDGKSEGYDDTQTFEPQSARKSYDRERSGSRSSSRGGSGSTSYNRSDRGGDRGRDSRRGSGRDSGSGSGRDFGRDSRKSSSRDSGRNSSGSSREGGRFTGHGSSRDSNRDSRPKSRSSKGRDNSENSSGFPGWAADNRERFADRDSRPSRKDSGSSGRSERSEKPRSASGKKSGKDNAGDKWWSTFDKGSKLIKAGSEKKKKKRKD